MGNPRIVRPICGRVDRDLHSHGMVVYMSGNGQITVDGGEIVIEVPDTTVRLTPDMVDVWVHKLLIAREGAVMDGGDDE